MPLVWAHAEHIKLLRSLADGAVFDLPPQPVRRYQRDRRPPRVTSWRPEWRASRIAPGRVLRIELPAPAMVTWSADDWRTRTETATRDTRLGVHAAELPAAPASGKLAFTWRRTDGDPGNNETFVVPIE